MLTNVTDSDEMPHVGLLIIFARHDHAVVDITKYGQCNDLASTAEFINRLEPFKCYRSIMAYAQA